MVVHVVLIFFYQTVVFSVVLYGGEIGMQPLGTGSFFRGDVNLYH